MNRIVKRILPESVWNVLRNARSSFDEERGEKGADWYDTALEGSDNFGKHYTESSYYKIWTVILDRVRRAQPNAVLEVGCGTGQLAHALHDAGLIGEYRGFDFSSKRIDQATRRIPALRFFVADAFATDVFDNYGYDLVLSTEFLEHVEGDLEILDRFRRGVRFIGTVPNYPWVSHVRQFDDVESILDRYGSRFDDFDVLPLRKDSKGHVLYVLEGTKR